MEVINIGQAVAVHVGNMDEAQVAQFPVSMELPFAGTGVEGRFEPAVGVRMSLRPSPFTSPTPMPWP